MKMKSVMQHNFQKVPQANIPRSVFNRSHGYKTTFDSGYLVPFLLDEILPGDTFRVNATLFVRMLTPIVPIIDNLYLDTFFFFVPNRLVWTNWVKFCGEQEDPDSSTDFELPRLAGGAGVDIITGSLGDYLGLPPGEYDVQADPYYDRVCTLPFRCYSLIWNEWFRDQNLQDSVVVDKDDGPDTLSDYVLLRRGKRHDYFTSCLPWPQKGDALALPLGIEAPVLGIGKGDQSWPGAGPYAVYETGTYTGTVNFADGRQISDAAAANAFLVEEHPDNAGYPYIRADLTNATAATINELREAFQMQKLFERDARGGTRYTEIVRSHFGVVSPDARLQRPEYLGGNSVPLMVTPVAQTSESGVGTPKGDLSAYVTGVDRRTGFTKSFTEHGYIIGLLNVRADLTYQQGVHRSWLRVTRWDLYWPTLAHLGEQEVWNREIWNTAKGADNLAVFGYQERYAEYRYKPSQITGKLRSDVAGTLDVWHLSQDFAALPTLSDTFIVDEPPIDRVVAVQEEPEFIMDSYIDMRCVRPIPVYGVPGLIDHF